MFLENRNSISKYFFLKIITLWKTSFPKSNRNKLYFQYETGISLSTIFSKRNSFGLHGFADVSQIFQNRQPKNKKNIVKIVFVDFGFKNTPGSSQTCSKIVFLKYLREKTISKWLLDPGPLIGILTIIYKNKTNGGPKTLI